MVNHIRHWLWVPFCNITWIALRGLHRFRGIGFRIPLRGISGFQVTMGLVIPEGWLGTVVDDVVVDEP